MASEYTILINGESGCKFIVRATSAIVAGLYDKRDSTFTKPDTTDIAEKIPYRWKRAFIRAGLSPFWFEDSAYINQQGRVICGNLPYATLYNSRGKYMATLTAIPN